MSYENQKGASQPAKARVQVMAPEQDGGKAPEPEPMPRKPMSADASFPRASYRVKVSAKCVSGMTDPDRGVRIQRTSDVKVTGPITEGSWLYCQIKAGLIEFTE